MFFHHPLRVPEDGVRAPKLDDTFLLIVPDVLTPRPHGHANEVTPVLADNFCDVVVPFGLGFEVPIVGNRGVVHALMVLHLFYLSSIGLTLLTGYVSTAP